MCLRGLLYLGKAKPAIAYPAPTSLNTFRAAVFPDRTAPSIYPVQTSAVSVPDQCTRPTDGLSDSPYAVSTPGTSGETQPPDHCSWLQSIS